MKQEDKELLLKDVCSRLPYKLVCEVKYKEEGKYKTSNMVLSGVFTNEAYFTSKEGSIYSTDYKPYLFPLSSITIEQEKELSKLGVSYGEYALHDDIRGLGIYVDEAYIFFEFCYKHHIDFLGLIEMGLANDATGLNIY